MVLSSDCHAACGNSAPPNRTPDGLLIAGCDPALSVLAAHAHEAGIDVVLANGNSARALEWLRGGKIDVAGTHLAEPPRAARILRR